MEGDFPCAVADSRVWGPIPLQGVLGIVIMKMTRAAEVARTEMTLPWQIDMRGPIEERTE